MAQCLKKMDLTIIPFKLLSDHIKVDFLYHLHVDINNYLNCKNKSTIVILKIDHA